MTPIKLQTPLLPSFNCCQAMPRSQPTQNLWTSLRLLWTGQSRPPLDRLEAN